MKYFKSTRPDALLLLMVLFIWGCATSPDMATKHAMEEDATVNVPPAGLDFRPAIHAVRISDATAQSRIIIDTTHAPSYTIFKLSNPFRILVDLPDFSAGEFEDLVDTGSSAVVSITATTLEDSSKSFLRLEILLAGDYSYSATSTERSISINLETAAPQPQIARDTPEQPAAPPQPPADSQPRGPVAYTIQDITVAAEKDTLVTISASRPIDKYFSYTLNNPNRLVLDIPGATSSIGKTTFKNRSPHVNNVRIGKRPDMTRIVLDLATMTFPLYQVSQSNDVLSITLQSESSPAASPPVTVETAASPPTAEQTPEAQTAAAPVAPAPAAEKISFDFKDADIKNVLRLIADISNMNMIVGEDVIGKVTLKLDDIPWNEALDLILETNGIGKIETPNVTRIETQERIRKINQEKLLAQKSQDEVEDLVVKTYEISYAKATDLSRFIKQMNVLSNRGSVVDFKLTNKVTVQDIPANLAKIDRIILEQDIPTRQVMIEAKIIQSNPSYVKELGIRWGGSYQTTRNGDTVTIGGGAGDGNIVNLPAAAGLGSGGAVNFGYISDSLTLNTQLSALEQQDKLKILSNPRVLGLDNNEARIKQGVALPYLKLSDQGVTSTEFKDAVLELTVTPKITAANTIALNVYVTKNQRSAQTGAGGEPGIDVREVETYLLVKSGDTVVIGGIYETTKSLIINKVPFFGNLPLLGAAFRYRKEEDQLTELLIFITVNVVDNPGVFAQTFNAPEASIQ